MLIIATVLQIIISCCHGSVMPKISKTEGIVNMNGDYLLSNSHPNGKWDSSYSKYEDVEYMDVYSPEISTKYGEVLWTSSVERLWQLLDMKQIRSLGLQMGTFQSQ